MSDNRNPGILKPFFNNVSADPGIKPKLSPGIKYNGAYANEEISIPFTLITKLMDDGRKSISNR